MVSAKRFTIVSCIFITILSGGVSCKKFADLNSDPNNVTPASASADYMMANVLTSIAQWYGNNGSGMMSGAMQQTCQDAFANTFSDYQWDPQDWTTNYSILRNNKFMLEKAQANGWKFHQGVALVMRGFNFANIADFWGDAPDSLAVKGNEAGIQYQLPAFDSQQQMYASAIADFKAALPFFSGTINDHPEVSSITKSSDVFYNGDPVKWKKLTYSLMLRYYMRLSAKEDVKASVEAIADSVFQSNDDDWKMPFPGVGQSNSYQFNSLDNGPSNFHRNKMCGTLAMKLKDLQDPRIVIMAQPINTPTVVDGSKFSSGDNTTSTQIVNGIRYINPAWATINNFKQFDPATYSVDRPYGAVRTSIKNLYDTSSAYVGIPISYDIYVDFNYNLNGVGAQPTSLSDYVSYLRTDIYDNRSGPLLAQRMSSYAEICFDLAEAKLKGWSINGTASGWYNNGVKASFDNWQVFSTYQADVNNYYGCVKDPATYLAQPVVAYDGTLSRIIEQKWIAAWQSCNEAYMDWRRTGLPALTIGWASYRGAIPLRFAYGNAELQSNSANADNAVSKLVPSALYNGPDGNNSSWSKTWLIQGTGKPW